MFDILRKQSPLQYASGRYDTKDFISRSNKNEYVERINETNEYEINPHYSQMGSQLTFTLAKLTIGTLEKGVIYYSS